MSSPARPINVRENLGRTARATGRAFGQFGLGVGESAFTTAEGITALMERFGPDVVSNFIANELDPIIERGDQFVREALPPAGLGEVGARIGGRLAGDIAQFVGTGGPVRRAAGRLGAGAATRGIVGSAPITAIQAAAGPDESTAGAVGSLLEGIGRAGPVSEGLRAVAEDPKSRIASEVGLDLLTGAFAEVVGSGIRRLRAPRVPRDVGGGSPLLPAGRETAPRTASGAASGTQRLARQAPGDEGDLFSMIGRSDRHGEAAFSGRGGIIPQESISERLIQGTGGLSSRQRVDLTRAVRQRVFPVIEEIMAESAVRAGLDIPGVARTSEGLGVFEGAINPNTVYNLGDLPAQLIEQRAAAHGIVEGQNAAVWFRLIGDDAVDPVNPGRAYIIAGPNGTNLDAADFRELHQIISQDPSLAPLAEGSTFFEGRAIYRNFGATPEGDYAALVRSAADRMGREVDLELARVEGNLLDGPEAYRAAFAGDQEALERLLRVHEFEVRPLFGDVGTALGDPDVAGRSRQFIDEVRGGAREADRARAQILPELVLAGALAGGGAVAASRGERDDVAMAATLGAIAGLAPTRTRLLRHLDAVNGVGSLKAGTARDVSGIGYVSRYLQPAEAAKLNRQSAARVVELFDSLPSAGELSSAALAGATKRGWYRQSSEAITEVFGPDAPRFTALLAALSPQNSVQQNLTNALNVWNGWVRAGRPVDAESIFLVMRDNVPAADIASLPLDRAKIMVERARTQLGFSELNPNVGLAGLREQLMDLPEGARRSLSVLPAWVNNSVRSLSIDEPVGLVLSGPKVDSFMRNLLEDTSQVTLDTWMAKVVGWEQAILGGSINVSRTDPGKVTPYLALAARVRQTADALTRMTGVRWTAEEVQETIWSWAYALGETAKPHRGALRTGALDPADLLGEVTDDLINATPDFRSLLNEPAYKEILIRGHLAAPGRFRQSAGAVSRAASEAETLAGFAPRGGDLERIARRTLGAT